MNLEHESNMEFIEQAVKEVLPDNLDMQEKFIRLLKIVYMFGYNDGTEYQKFLELESI